MCVARKKKWFVKNRIWNSSQLSQHAETLLTIIFHDRFRALECALDCLFACLLWVPIFFVSYRISTVVLWCGNSFYVLDVILATACIWFIEWMTAIIPPNVRENSICIQQEYCFRIQNTKNKHRFSALIRFSSLSHSSRLLLGVFIVPFDCM